MYVLFFGKRSMTVFKISRRAPFVAVAFDYGVASISRLLKMIGLFCKRAL